jgi:hypothetical protein
MEKNIIIVYLVIEIVLHLNLTTENIDVIVKMDIIFFLIILVMKGVLFVISCVKLVDGVKIIIV